MSRCANGHEVANANFQFCPICGDRLEIPEEETASPESVSAVTASSAFGTRATASEAFGEPPSSSPPPAETFVFSST